MRRCILPLIGCWFAILLLAPLNGLSQPVAEGRLVPPEEWQQADLESATGRYGAIAMRLQSPALAESTRTGLLNLGWRPVMIQPRGESILVVVGNLSSPARAQYVAEELKAQQLGDAEVFAFPRGTQGDALEIDGPFLPAFLPTPGMAKPYDWDVRGKARLRGILRGLPEAEAEEFEELTGQVLLGVDDGGVRGGAAAAIAKRLMDQRTDPDLALFLAGKVARGEWASSAPEMLECGEYVADLLYGHRRDWRGAWAATQALLAHPERSAEGRARDRLRRAALLVDLAAGAQTPKPSWGQVRSELRQAWDHLPANQRRLAAKVELIYMQTYAWQGQWERVEELARAIRRRYPKQKAESAVASVFLARSFERRSEFERAIALLDSVIQQDYAPGETLYMGAEALNIPQMAAKWRRYFAELQAGGAPRARQTGG